MPARRRRLRGRTRSTHRSSVTFAQQGRARCRVASWRGYATRRRNSRARPPRNACLHPPRDATARAALTAPPTRRLQHQRLRDTPTVGRRVSPCGGGRRTSIAARHAAAPTRSALAAGRYPAPPRHPAAPARGSFGRLALPTRPLAQRLGDRRGLDGPSRLARRSARGGCTHSTSSAAGLGGSGRWAARMRKPAAASSPPRGTRRRSPTGCPTGRPAARPVGLVEQAPEQQEHHPHAGREDHRPVAAGQVEALRCERAQSRASTPSATSKIAASTQESTWKALRFVVALSFPRPVASKRLLWYHGRSMVSDERAPPAGQVLLAPKPAPGGPMVARHAATGAAARAPPCQQHAGVVLGHRAQLALEREPPVLGGPLADVLEVVLDGLGGQPVVLARGRARAPL